jgi:hypothetical protein
VVLALLAVPVVLALRRTVAEASALRRSLSELSDVAPLVRQLQLEAAALASEVPVALRRRSVVAGAEQGVLPPGRE